VKPKTLFAIGDVNHLISCPPARRLETAAKFLLLLRLRLPLLKFVHLHNILA